MPKLTSSILATCCGLILIGSLAGCGNSDKKTTSTQVVAKVNDTEISMHQLNLILKSAQNVTPDNAPLIRQQILEKLIDQQIIVEKANKENLDRTPDVMMAIEAAKKDILARAYLQKMVANSVKVSDQDIRKYYEEHPGLFAKRRIYTLQDIGIEKSAEAEAILSTDITQEKTMQEIADLLKSKNIKFSGGNYTRPAEQIPLDVLPKLQDINDGQSVVIEVGNAIHVIKVLKAQNAPIDLAASTPFIKNYFMNTRGKEFVETEVKNFRKEAKVEYMGDFANQANAPKQSKPDNQVEVTKPADDKSSKNSTIEAGVAGLK